MNKKHKSKTGYPDCEEDQKLQVLTLSRLLHFLIVLGNDPLNEFILIENVWKKNHKNEMLVLWDFFPTMKEDTMLVTHNEFVPVAYLRRE